MPDKALGKGQTCMHNDTLTDIHKRVSPVGSELIPPRPALGPNVVPPPHRITIPFNSSIDILELTCFSHPRGLGLSLCTNHRCGVGYHSLSLETLKSSS